VAAREPGWWPGLRRAAPWLLLAAAAAVGVTWAARGAFFGGDPAVQVWAFTPLAVGFAALLVLAVDARAGSPLSRVLRGRMLAGAGRYSYGLYVLHYPIFLALEAAGLSAAAIADATGAWWAGVAGFTALAGAATLAGALLSWHLLERRFLAWKDLVPYGPAPGLIPAPRDATPRPPTAPPRPAER
jgi:peptidoglycan/LPS O-acetylase OafA/YrhL